MKLTDKQLAALEEATPKGHLFQLPESRRHSPATLSSLAKAGLLKKEPVGVIWSLTPEGAAALQSRGRDKPKGA